jgi:predicted TIM-barrel fold metal-dependent hydrolase
MIVAIGRTLGRSSAVQIIDFHTHIYPDAIAHKAAESIRQFYQLGDSSMDGSVDVLLKTGKEAGISRFVVLPVALKPDRVRHINDFIHEQVALHPEFTGFGTLHAAMEGMEEETERLIAMGLRGIKMHPDSQVFAIDDKRLFPAYEILQDKQLPVVLHMGDLRFDYSHPLRLRRVLELFPKLQVVAAHFGGYSMYETAYEVLCDKDCFFDISSSMIFMADGVAEKYIRKYGAERMVYGTDFPLWDPRTEVKRFLELKLSQDEMEQIAYKTALHILKED